MLTFRTKEFSFWVTLRDFQPEIKTFGFFETRLKNLFAGTEIYITLRFSSHPNRVTDIRKAFKIAKM